MLASCFCNFFSISLDPACVVRSRDITDRITVAHKQVSKEIIYHGVLVIFLLDLHLEGLEAHREE